MKEHNGHSKIDKISKYGNVTFIVVLYTVLTTAIGMVIGDYFTKKYQRERFEMKKFLNINCYDDIDIYHIIEGVYE